MSGAEAGFKSSGRIVIVGASLAGLRAAEALRREGFAGKLTLVGDEPCEPYDRPPLSKQVLSGWVPADHTALPRLRKLDAEWRLGVAAAGLDLGKKQVRLADGQTIEFDRLLITTGVRARPWPNAAEAALDGVFAIRTREDAGRLQAALAAKPRRVLVIGAGFTGSETASICRELGLEVTVAERGGGPLEGALGSVVSAVAAQMQRDEGVDLRCGVTVEALESGADGRLCRAKLSDGTALDVDVAVVALGSIRNTEWLRDSGLAAGPLGVACDAGCRVFDLNGIVTDDVFVAGDVARAPYALFGYQLMALEHWSNAVAQSEIAAHNMVCAQTERRPHLSIPAFWSSQFGVNIKSIGVPSFSDQVMITQGSVESRRFVAAYGYRGRLTAAVTFNQGKWLEYFEPLIEQATSFPPAPPGCDQAPGAAPIPAGFPPPGVLAHQANIMLTGHSPTERRVVFVPPREGDS